MNWLSPFLTPAGFVELAIVIGVFGYLFQRFGTQNAQLKSLDEALQSERQSLQKAQAAIVESRAANENAPARVSRLNSVLVKDSLVWKRGQLTSRNRFRRPEATLPQHFYDVTEEARYWQGAFVFIGLAGTLVCLGLAVAYLTLLVGRNASETSITTGLKEVVAHMTAVFGGMGAAFLSTASGVGFTLTLAGKINVQERGWERLRDQVEEFSLLEIEPLAAQMLERTEELPRLEAAVARMESIANTFTAGLESTLAGLQATGDGARELRQANEAIAQSLARGADTLDGATATFAGASGELSGGLEALHKAIHAHGATLGDATRQWNEAGQNSLELLRGAVERAAQTFLELNEMRREMLSEAAKTQGALLDSTRATLDLGREMKVANQSSLSTLREEIARGLLRVADSIDGGVHNEKLLLDQFGALLEGMGEYAMRVEETLLQLPASLGSEPLLLVEGAQEAALSRVGEGVGHVRGEISALRGELREAIVRELPGALGQSLNGLSGVGKGVETLRGEVQDSLAASRGVQDNLAGLSAQVNNLSAQVAQMRASTARLDRGIVISWPWSRP